MAKVILNMITNIVQEYITAINRQDLGTMRALMTEDHEFVDAGDGHYSGRDEILKGWPDYYDMFPDYAIEVSEILEHDDRVVVFGHASATYRNLKNPANSNSWRIPAAWKAIVRNNKIAYWQVFCNYSSIHEIMLRNDPG
jgi:ketosteroid isomerase-like protein